MFSMSASLVAPDDLQAMLMLLRASEEVEVPILYEEVRQKPMRVVEAGASTLPSKLRCRHVLADQMCCV